MTKPDEKLIPEKVLCFCGKVAVGLCLKCKKPCCIVHLFTQKQCCAKRPKEDGD